MGREAVFFSRCELKKAALKLPVKCSERQKACAVRVRSPRLWLTATIAELAAVSQAASLYLYPAGLSHAFQAFRWSHVMKHVKLLSYFVAVAHHRSIREAANFLHLTSSALNRHILDLEEELSAPLFERHARGVRLSAAGETYLAYAKKALCDAEDAHSSIRELEGLKRGHIKIAAVAAIADVHLIDLIATFQTQYPKVSFAVKVAGADKVVDAVVENDCDLGLAFNPSQNADFHELAQAPYSIHALVKRDHVLASAESISISSTADYPLALADTSWGGRRLLDEYLKRNGTRIYPQMESNSFQVLTDFVRRTGGICFQVRKEGGERLVDDDLVALPVSELRRYQRRMILGVLRGRVLPVAAARFSELLKKSLFSELNDNSPGV